jgi:hypothetical protein
VECCVECTHYGNQCLTGDACDVVSTELEQWHSENMQRARLYSIVRLKSTTADWKPDTALLSWDCTIRMRVKI